MSQSLGKTLLAMGEEPVAGKPLSEEYLVRLEQAAQMDGSLGRGFVKRLTDEVRRLRHIVATQHQCISTVNDGINAAVRLEREACAKVAEAHGLEAHDDAPGVVRSIAAAIRARGGKTA